MALRWPLAALAAAAVAAPAAAQVVAGAPSAASVTIYRDRQLSTTELADFDPASGLAMITETRVVDVRAGPQRIAFRGVADTLVPETVSLDGLPGRIVERNEDFDLLTPGSLVARSVGETVRVVQTDRRTGKATVRPAVIRSGPNGVVLDFDGPTQGTKGAEALGCGGPPTRLVFDHVPQNLGDKPTFSLLADVPQAGRYTVKLSYLATGFTWTADYVARIRPDGRTLDLDGWLTLANKSAAGFAQAPTQVVAGNLQRDAGTRPPEPETETLTEKCWGARPPPPRPMPMPPPMAYAARGAVVEEMVVTAQKRKAIQSELGDYKLYTLPEPTTVAARQTKQVAFLEETAVPFERVYVYRLGAYAGFDPDHPVDAPDVVLRLQNKKAAGLGKPLPAGTVTVMEDAAGALAVAGQQGIADTAVGLPLELILGKAMDVGVAARTTDDRTRGPVATRSVVAVLVNDKPQPIVLEFHQERFGADFKLTAASQRPVEKAGDEVWTIRLAPGQRADLSYSFSVRND